MRSRLSLAASATIVVAVVGLLVACGVGSPLGSVCDVRAEESKVPIDPEQVANAATIAAVGIRQQVPDQAVVVALATALQESKLRNLSEGDRDSVGLFQQRPSQGWGTPDQLQDPRYAAGRFYEHLLRVDGWQDLSVTDAAQAVQRSAHPQAYQKWADEADILARAFVGSESSAVACSLPDKPAKSGDAAAEGVATALRLDWGDVSSAPLRDRAGLTVAVSDQRTGWQYTHWLVAQADRLGVRRVEFAGQQWSADKGDWKKAGRASVRQVIAETDTGA